MKILGKITATVSILFTIPLVVFAQQNYSRIGATIKVSVCGDNIVEGEEQCEIGLQQQYNCKNFGYLPKEISCDISCAYDLLSCEPIPQVIKTDNAQIIEETKKNTPSIPILLLSWDKNSDGKLNIEEFATFINNWVDSWKTFVVLPKENDEKEIIAKECDINQDKACNVTDFSIILYYLNIND